VVGWYALSWLPDVTPCLRKYFAQKCLLELARLGEVPIVPVTVIGITCWVVGKLRSGSEREFRGRRATAEMSSVGSG
jgi:hypothetical protein